MLKKLSNLLGTMLLAAGLLVPAAAMAQTPATARVKSADIKLGASCVTAECHGDLKNIKFTHGPMNMMQCEPCHVPVTAGRHEFKPVVEGRNLCMTCHEMEKAKSVQHAPFAQDCTLCHQPHGGDNRHFLKGGEGSGSCKVCHDSVTKGMTQLHGPVAAGDCMACHSPHQSDNKALLVDAPQKLCVSCHIDVAANIKDAIAVHPPVEEGCTTCHNPHGSNMKFFLAAEGSDLCLNCHGEFLDKSAHSPYPHAQMTKDKSCQECHSPHASKLQGLLLKPSGDLCLSCHNKDIQAQDGTKVVSVSAQLEHATFLHGPVREKNCVACHKPHGSEFPMILRKAFPKEFYAPFVEGAYDLCFECHDKTVVQDAASHTTGFRDGERNLHFLHVNREKGRTCRACHAEHAAVQEKNIRTETPFGRWNMKVKFTKSLTGGTCETGCHTVYSYDREKPIGPLGAKQ